MRGMDSYLLEARLVPQSLEDAAGELVESVARGRDQVSFVEDQEQERLGELGDDQTLRSLGLYTFGGVNDKEHGVNDLRAGDDCTREAKEARMDGTRTWIAVHTCANEGSMARTVHDGDLQRRMMQSVTQDDALT